jgi:hypothetical protein
MKDKNGREKSTVAGTVSAVGEVVADGVSERESVEHILPVATLHQSSLSRSLSVFLSPSLSLARAASF